MVTTQRGAIRALEVPYGTHLSIIAMTANAFAEDRKNALECGMDAHLAKPIRIDVLMISCFRL